MLVEGRHDQRMRKIQRPYNTIGLIFGPTTKAGAVMLTLLACRLGALSEIQM